MNREHGLFPELFRTRVRGRLHVEQLAELEQPVLGSYLREIHKIRYSEVQIVCSTDPVIRESLVSEDLCCFFSEYISKKHRPQNFALTDLQFTNFIRKFKGVNFFNALFIACKQQMVTVLRVTGYINTEIVIIK